MEVREPMKKRILIFIIASITLAICLTGCFNNGKKTELGERYDSNEILVGEEVRTIGEERFAEIFDKYSKAAGETEFVIHESTAIVIAEAVMRELYPDDNYGVVYLPAYFRPLYYKAENCWEVQLHKGALDTTLSTSEQISAEVMCVYVDVSSGAVRAIIPAIEFSIHNPENSDNRTASESCTTNSLV